MKPSKRKLRIIEAAYRVINQVGISGTTMRGIAEEAGLSTGALYHHYRNKEEILYAVMDHSLSVSTRIAEVAKQGGHSREEIIKEISSNICTRFNKIDENKMQFYLAQEAILGNTEIRDKFGLKYHEWIGRTEDLMQYLYNMQPGKYNKAIASLLIGAIDGVVLQILLGANTAEVNDICKVYQYLLKEGLPSLLEHQL